MSFTQVSVVRSGGLINTTGAQWPLLDLDTRGHPKADVRVMVSKAFFLFPVLWFVSKVVLLCKGSRC